MSIAHQPASTDRLRDHAAMLLFALLISVSFTLGDQAVPHIAPGPLTAARFALAVMIMGLIILPEMRRIHFHAPWRYILLGGLMAGYFILMFEALAITDPVSTGAVFTLTPIMSAVFGWLLMRQITTGSMALALALAGGGALWVIFRGDTAALISLRFGPGEQLFLIGCMAHALYTPLVRLTRREEPVRVYTFGMLCGGLLVTGIYSAPDVLATDWAVLPPVAWVGILYLGVFTTAITALLLQFAALRLPAAKVMAYGYLVPTFVIIEEGLIGNGWIAPIVWLGVAGTIAGLLILLRED